MPILVNSSALLAIVQFSAFLVRHLPVIAPKVIVLLFDNKTSHLANHISSTLSGSEMLTWNDDHSTKRQIAVRETSLLINFVKPDGSRPYKFLSDNREIFFVMDTKISIGRFRLSPSDLIVQAFRNPLLFVTWKSVEKGLKEDYILDEDELLKSFAWLAFIRRVVQLPPGKFLLALDYTEQYRNGVANNAISAGANISGIQNSVFYVSGFRIGIYKIVCEKLKADGMNYLKLIDTYKTEYNQSKPMRYKDKRLSWRYFHQNQSDSESGIHISFKYIKNTPIYTNSQPNSFVVVVPRVIVSGLSSKQVFIQLLLKCLVIVGLLVVIAFFASVRYFFRWAIMDVPIAENDLFLDTFARSLGISPRNWTVRNIAERQLFVVVGIFGILTGSFLSGILYEQLVADEPVRYLYNSLKDVCRMGVNIALPFEVGIDLAANVNARTNLK